MTLNIVGQNVPSVYVLEACMQHVDNLSFSSELYFGYAHYPPPLKIPNKNNLNSSQLAGINRTDWVI